MSTGLPIAAFERLNVTVGVATGLASSALREQAPAAPPIVSAATTHVRILGIRVEMILSTHTDGIRSARDGRDARPDRFDRSSRCDGESRERCPRGQGI